MSADAQAINGVQASRGMNIAIVLLEVLICKIRIGPIYEEMMQVQGLVNEPLDLLQDGSGAGLIRLSNLETGLTMEMKNQVHF
ncbi:hypothetical protein AK812_SmicGene29362 [Symbiodinium microadriaticum]|uniref:Uncharacterized protein n=1 Tax=Symbiodinium microadriaticum TaxID=2951 RepID=A0A1Q9D226_SYMMI|nr:hypothetical protein AK812_SmicGene29362 [Symbiodinium microadriaticum]